MPVSRLRLQLATRFAVVFLLGLITADLALFMQLRREAHRRFNRELTRSAGALVLAVRHELADDGSSLATAAAEALADVPPGPIGFVLYDAAGTRIAARGPDSLTRQIPPLPMLPPGDHVWNLPLNAGNLRVALVRSSGAPAFGVVALQPTASLRRDSAGLAWWLALSAPLVVLLALAAGYFLARQALAPLRAMTQAISAIAPPDLDRQLPVRSPPDELDALAEQFNRLLQRLSEGRAGNRRFLGRVAHQLKTPLTVVRGESALGLERSRTLEEHRDLLRRLSVAAEQMTQRVDDLLLLAQAEAGERPPLTDRIELDGLVLECVDVMRGRAQALGRHLELATVEAVEVVGNEPLAREAILELLENACRHGAAGTAIQVSTLNGPTAARVEVSSGGAAVPASTLEESAGAPPAERPGLGLSIVRWIALVHSGRLGYRHAAGVNTFVLELAAALEPPAGGSGPN